jgi:hypothetical protein
VLVSAALARRRERHGRVTRLEEYMLQLRNRIIALGSLADLATVDDVGDTSAPVGDEPADVEAEIYTKPGTGPVTSSLHRGRARVGWPAAGIDICGDGCFMCFYPNHYDKVFHQNHIVYVQATCGDGAWVRDNYGNDGMMRKGALYNW